MRETFLWRQRLWQCIFWITLVSSFASTTAFSPPHLTHSIRCRRYSTSNDNDETDSTSESKVYYYLDQSPLTRIEALTLPIKDAESSSNTKPDLALYSHWLQLDLVDNVRHQQTLARSTNATSLYLTPPTTTTASHLSTNNVVIGWRLLVDWKEWARTALESEPSCRPWSPPGTTVTNNSDEDHDVSLGLVLQDATGWTFHVRAANIDSNAMNGVDYVEFAVPSGYADRVALFYEKVLEAPVTRLGSSVAIVAVGAINVTTKRAQQSLVFRETGTATTIDDSPSNLILHLSVADSDDFYELWSNAQLAGVLDLDGSSDSWQSVQQSRQFCLEGLVDLESGRDLLPLPHVISWST